MDINGLAAIKEFNQMVDPDHDGNYNDYDEGPYPPTLHPARELFTTTIALGLVATILWWIGSTLGAGCDRASSSSIISPRPHAVAAHAPKQGPRARAISFSRAALGHRDRLPRDFGPRRALHR